MARLLIWLIRAYQSTLSPWFSGHCRFHPSCSHYGIEAIQRHGAGRGAWLTMRRLLRCHPFGGQGVDLVPPARKERCTI